ncbi:MAG: adenylate/guanylate cyclase domain-containing protein, partial [Proteobacteria bacterium]|nr:adenylate/guanylate cyclase domain-containing protein [Pseudomonadota bacterium]
SVYLRTLTVDNTNQGHIRNTLASDGVNFVKMSALFLGLFVGGCLALVIYNLFVYLSLRHRPHLYYVIYQLSALVALCIYTGPLTAIWPQDISPKLPYRLLMAAAMLAVFMFVRFANGLLISVGGQTRREAVALNVGYAMIAAEVLLIPFIAPTLLFCGFIAILALWVPVMVVLHAKKIRHDRIYYMVLGIAILITGIVGPTLANVGLLPFTALMSQLYYISALIEGILVSMALAHQIRALQWERHAILDAISSDQSRGHGDQAIHQLIGSSLRVTQRVAQQELSVMFVDTANFSRLAATAPNAQVLRDLSRQIGAIHTAVEAHHGVVDRSLGDGVLAVFGYENKRALPLHARDAFDAAVAIQAAAVDAANDHHSEDRLVFPLRIGINTAPVLVGNLGGRGRIDFTMIGEGVNFARRLEASASPFNIVLSEATMLALRDSGLAPDRFGDMQLKVKHREDFIKAFEFNPFSDRLDLLARAKSACMARLGMKREEQRLVVTGEPAGWLMSEVGRLTIVDFSRHGLCVAANMLLGQKATFLCSFETKNQSVAARLDELLANEFMVEVRWSRGGAQGYVSGLRFVGMNDALTNLIFESMCTALGLTQLSGDLPEAEEPPAA